MTLANPSHCHCDKFEPSEEVLEIARNGDYREGMRNCWRQKQKKS